MEAGATRPRRRRWATFLSTAGHPFVLVPLTIAIGARPAWLGVLVAGLTVVAMTVVIARRVRAGVWRDHDISDPTERRSLYPPALAVVGVGALAAWGVGVPGDVVRGFVAALAMLVVGAFVTRVSKLSLHVMFGAYCAAVLAGVHGGLGLAMAGLVAGVGWSRVALGRHTVGQVWLGALVGGAAGAGLVLVNRALAAGAVG